MCAGSPAGTRLRPVSADGRVTVELGRRLTDAIRRHALLAHPEEACGILVGRLDVGRVRVRHALPCTNRAPAAERTHRFEIDPRAVLNLQRALRQTSQAVVGFYHSHPGSPPEPSRTDLRYLRLWPETVWLIVGVEDGCEGRLRAWWLDAPRVTAENRVEEAGTPARRGGGRAWGHGPVPWHGRVPSHGRADDARTAEPLDAAPAPGRPGGNELGANGLPYLRRTRDDPTAPDRIERSSLRELPIEDPQHAQVGGCPE